MKRKEKLRDLHPYQKRLLRLLCVVLAAFVLYNIIWLPYREYRYGGLMDAVGYAQATGTWSAQRDGCHYDVIPPAYLQFNGNLSTDVNDNNEGLIIWPQFPTGYKYAAVLYTGTTMQNGVSTRNMVVIAMDERGNWVDEGNQGYGEREKELLRERQADIQSWIAQANKVWELNTDNE